MTAWAIDLGTTNTSVARWDQAAQRPRLIDLPDVCRKPGGEDHLEAPRLVPSATDVIDNRGLWARLGGWGPLARHFFIGKLATIGRQALERNRGSQRPSFAPSFKPYLTREALRPLARVGGRTLTARDVAGRFIRELLAEIKATRGERIRTLAVTAPVDSFEAYRAELRRIFRRYGVSTLHFIDEPVAAAVGYGLSLRARRVVLVIDFGAGTLDLALVAVTASGVRAGECTVLAKQGREVGGNRVDQWILEALCRDLEYPLNARVDDESARFWYRMMLDEARRVKEAVFFRDSEPFELTPPDDMRAFEARIRGDVGPIDVSRDQVMAILRANQLYDTLHQCLDSVLESGREAGVGPDDIDDVLMVGGSTLLPGVYPLFDEVFGRDRVRAWQPFEAVAYGACAFAAASFTQSDFIVHDYAFVTHDAQTHEPEYTVIVERGTRFPTAPDHWRRRLVPSCALGEPETIFKLVVCEIGRTTDDERQFRWDAQGNVHKLGGGGEVDGGPLVVPLNDSNPTLGTLEPPHSPSDRKPRLEIAFGVNADRWLCVTVRDLKTNRMLMRDELVVRLL